MFKVPRDSRAWISSGVHTHRTLNAWVEARQISLAVLELSRTQWKPHASSLFDQLQRAGLSIQLNIAEGYGLADARFGNHLATAYGSAAEASDLIELGMEAGVIPEATGKALLTRVEGCRQLLLGLLKRYRPMPRREKRERENVKETA